MANRRCLQTLTRHYTSIFSLNPLQSFETLPYLQQTLALTLPNPLHSLTPKFHHISTNLTPTSYTHFTIPRRFSSKGDDCDDDEDDDGERDTGESDDDDDDDETVSGSSRSVQRTYTPEEKEEEAAAIGYTVVGPLDRSDRVFKPYEPVFAVVQIGSHQFKVSNGDCIYTERLKFCEVNDKLILNRVLMLGSSTQTIIGRPVLPDAAVHAVVEEHALDAKVIIFKKKKRKNYRRTKGHRQELTKLRITNIEGIEKQEVTASGKAEKASAKKVEKVAVAA